ncbi:hypothetical protein P280DRAFT_255914 [Massarina eburnea CBS 473.64]|uniref:C3H1-type domain-containing protein n=1 Tax=Massarina eburnea CBS 473.64 TaxID=1395130 RepID=A0A6A6S7D6_9PLEO|nr:hypothetical protein P280DRAFT_255914 [Massarina eburnea CBS 473.64]
MAPSHVPSDHLPHQGQSIYTDPTYTSLFPHAADQFGPQSPWSNGQLNGLASPNQPWHHSTYLQQQPQSYSPISQPYQNPAQGLRTASPYQYAQFASPASLPSYGHAANVDPSLAIDASTLHQQQHSPYAIGAQSLPPQQSQSNTVTPQALQQGLAVQNPRPTSSPYQTPRATSETFAAQRPVQQVFTRPAQNPEYELPTGRKSGAFVILDQSALAKATKSSPLNKLVTLGSEPFHLPSNRTALPVYTSRQSVKDLRKAGADNKKLLAKKLPAKRLSSGKILQEDASDSESYDDSSDDSEYTDEEDDEPSPLPASRPEGTHEATRYDVIKATWHSRKSQPNSEKIKTSLRDFWEVVNTIQKRWRNDSKAVSEAEENKKVYELPELKQRVNGQRALLCVALKTALEFAHPDVLDNFGQVKPFLYLCYLFLANRVKALDYDGDLPSVIYEVLARCVSTLTTELLEETKVIKALNTMKKKTNEKHTKLIQEIIVGAAAGSKKAKASSPPVVETTADPKGAKRPAPQPLGRPAVSAPNAKKLKPSESTTNGEKKLIVGTTAMKPTTAAPTQAKRPGDKATPALVKNRVTQIVNKPSGLFASLNAAGKKPATTSNTASTSKPAPKALSTTKDKKPAPAGSAKPAFSFAETMAELMKPKVEEPVASTKTEKQLPPETAEEKTKRLRKESRRHLRVKFRPEASLVAIRYFSHDPEEESGHDENMVRDAGDIGGEGRMFKQHKEMEDDEDDEPEIDYRPWTEPSSIDFSRVDIEERKRNFEPFGGGLCKPECPEKEANINHERVTLLIHYAHPSDIPLSPREPLESQTASALAATVTEFGAPPQLVMDRVPNAIPAIGPQLAELLKNMMVPQQTAVSQSVPAPSMVPTPSAPAAPPPADIPSLLGALQQGQGQIAMPPVPAPFSTGQQATAGVDIGAILSVLGSNMPQINGFPQVPPQGGASWPAGLTLPQGFSLPQDGGAAYQPQMQTQTQTQTQMQPQQQQQQHNQHSRNGHKRQRDDGIDNERSYDTAKKGKFSKRHKVIPCKFFQIGKCNKGDDCTYIHDS